MSGSQKTNRTLGGERKTGVFPWHLSQGNQGTDYMQERINLPLAPLSGKPGDSLHAGKDKPSPGTLSG